MKELTIIEEFPINIQDFFQLFIISDNFKKKYHEKRKDFGSQINYFYFF